MVGGGATGAKVLTGAGGGSLVSGAAGSTFRSAIGVRNVYAEAQNASFMVWLALKRETVDFNGRN